MTRRTVEGEGAVVPAGARRRRVDRFLDHEHRPLTTPGPIGDDRRQDATRRVEHGGARNVARSRGALEKGSKPGDVAREQRQLRVVGEGRSDDLGPLREIALALGADGVAEHDDPRRAQQRERDDERGDEADGERA
jgi:hypothetical protein